MKHFFILILCLISLSINAQNNAIAAGEKLIYTASYNMSGILTDIAQVTMETSEAKTSKATLLRLKCSATTYSKWDNFFKIFSLNINSNLCFDLELEVRVHRLVEWTELGHNSNNNFVVFKFDRIHSQLTIFCFTNLKDKIIVF